MGLEIHAIGIDRTFQCSYIGFANLRNQIAKAYDEDFYKIYSDIKMCLSHTSEWENAINNVIAKKQFPDEDEDILDFFFSSDCGGSISHKTCKKIHDLIKDIDFAGCVFTYGAYSDGKDYEHFKDFLKTCYSKRNRMRWD